MATDLRRVNLSIHDERTVRVLGLDPEKMGGTEAWAALARYSAAVEEAGRLLEQSLTREEWLYLADCLNGCAELSDWTPDPFPSRTLILAQVEDAQRLDDLGAKWFGGDLEDQRQGQTGVERFLAKLRTMKAVDFDAILAAVRWFWGQPDDQRHIHHVWWRVADRVRPQAAKIEDRD